jgi:exonuclease SbcD
VRFVHAADLHVDSPLVGLERYEGAPVAAIRGATRRALENLVDLCLREEARLLVIAGDLFDGKWRDFGTGLFFVAQMARLREGGVQVVVARGNHDAESTIPRYLRLPENVRELPTARPATIELEDLGIAVHGQSYATRAVSEDLAARYPQALGGVLNLGVLHTDLDGRPGHDRYASTTVRRLEDRGYAYWALGHVHAREVVSTTPWIVFPGNLQGRHARERGAKGATVVEVEGGRVASVTHAALDVVRFDSIDVALDAGDDDADAVDRARAAIADAVERAEGRLLAVHVRFTGHADAHAALAADLDRTASEVRAAALDVAGDRAWIADVSTAVRPRSTEGDGERSDALGLLAAAARHCAGDAEAARAVAAELEELRKLDDRVLEGALPDPDDAEGRARFFAEVEELLRARLANDEGRGEA